MAVNKSTWYLLGQATGGSGEGSGFSFGWQYGGSGGTWANFVRNITSGGYSYPPGLGNELTLSRDGTVRISNGIKNSQNKLYQVGVIFVREWTNTKQALGGKFEWIGRGEMDGSHHDTNTQNIVKKLESPVGRTKTSNYWYEHGAPKGPAVVSRLLKTTSGAGGVIVACVGDELHFVRSYSWNSIGG